MVRRLFLFSKTFLQKVLTKVYFYDNIGKLTVQRVAGVAQLVEQLICNQQVGGSSPSTSSTLSKLGKYGRFPEWPKGADCKSVVFRLRWSESTTSHQTKIRLKSRVFSLQKNSRWSV